MGISSLPLLFPMTALEWVPAFYSHQPAAAQAFFVSGDCPMRFPEPITKDIAPRFLTDEQKAIYVAGFNEALYVIKSMNQPLPAQDEKESPQ